MACQKESKKRELKKGSAVKSNTGAVHGKSKKSLLNSSFASKPISLSI